MAVVGSNKHEDFQGKVKIIQLWYDIKKEDAIASMKYYQDLIKTENETWQNQVKVMILCIESIDFTSEAEAAVHEHPIG